MTEKIELEKRLRQSEGGTSRYNYKMGHKHIHMETSWQYETRGPQTSKIIKVNQKEMTKQKCQHKTTTRPFM